MDAWINEWMDAWMDGRTIVGLFKGFTQAISPSRLKNVSSPAVLRFNIECSKLITTTHTVRISQFMRY